jgi:hypothetical protein
VIGHDVADSSLQGSLPKGKEDAGEKSIDGRQTVHQRQMVETLRNSQPHPQRRCPEYRCPEPSNREHCYAGDACSRPTPRKGLVWIAGFALTTIDEESMKRPANAVIRQRRCILNRNSITLKRNSGVLNREARELNRKSRGLQH